MKKTMVFEGIVAILVIVLLFAMYVMVTSSNGGIHNINSTGPVSSIYQGKDGMLYAFGGENGNTIYAIDGDGHLRWTLKVPDRWSVFQHNNPFPIFLDFRYGTYGEPGTHTSGREANDAAPLFSADNGFLYLCVADNKTFNDAWNTGANESLLAISPSGKILWEKRLKNDLDYTGAGLNAVFFNYYSVNARNGTIYLFDNHNLSVLDDKGSTRFTVPNVYLPPAVDESGNFYFVPWDKMSMVMAYHPNGTLYWVRDLAMDIHYPDFPVNPMGRPGFESLPMYANQTIYAPVTEGVWALDTNGSVKWTKNFNNGTSAPLMGMPIDDHGNLYFERYPIGAAPFLDVVTNDGKDIMRDMGGYNEIYGDPKSGRTYNAVYLITNLTSGPISPTELVKVKLSAYDAINDRYLWNHTFSPDPISMVIGNDQLQQLQSTGIYGTEMMYSGYGNQYEWNVKLLPWGSYDIGNFNFDSYKTSVNIIPPRNTRFDMGLKVLPGAGVTFVNYYAANYGAYTHYDPGKKVDVSNCTYANVLYALDGNGSVVWERPLDSYVTSMASSNGTIYYSTGDGKLNTATINGVAGGVTLAALAYVFIRFFLIGAVARAKGRLDKNANRNGVFNYLVGNPGSTLRDVSRGLRMNLGTVRYHTLILGLNHRVLSYKADDKHVRYFTNSNSYSREEQFVISLMKRDGIRRILKLLMERPGLTNIELTKELKIQESAMSRYMKELAEKGIVAREQAEGSGNLYSISREHRDAVAGAIERLKA